MYCVAVERLPCDHRFCKGHVVNVNANWHVCVKQKNTAATINFCRVARSARQLVSSERNRSLTPPRAPRLQPLNMTPRSSAGRTLLLLLASACCAGTASAQQALRAVQKPQRVCQGDTRGDRKCNHDSTHRVCAEIGDAKTSFWKHTGQRSWCNTRGHCAQPSYLSSARASCRPPIVDYYV